jgi:hypothetical protein
VDGEVHGAAVKLEEAETRPKDGRSGSSAWRCLMADGEPTMAACVGARRADVRAREWCGDQVKLALEKGSPAAGGWGAASWSTRGVSRGEQRGSKRVLHFDEAMP